MTGSSNVKRFAGAFFMLIGITTHTSPTVLKSSFMLVAFVYANLMISMAKVNQAKHCCFAKVVKQIGNMQD